MDARERQKRVLSELADRGRRRTKLDPQRLLFGAQRRFVADPAHNVAACYSHHTSKSYKVAFKLLEKGFQFERSHCLYIVQSRETAKDIIWAPLQELDAKLELGLKFRENDGNVILPNGSKILLKGGGTKREVDKLRGGKHPLVVIDEAQGFGTVILDYLLEEVIEPATLDYGRDGQVMLTGTPNAACAGYFYEATHGKHGWAVHHWTMVDNPHLPDPEGWISAKQERNGWPDDHPKLLREYRGVWVRDAEGLVYRFNDLINTIPTFRPQDAPDWEYILGIDLGYNDPTAFVIVAYSEALGQAQVVSSYKESGLTPSRVAAEVESLLQDYRVSRVVADTGGFGKGYVEEMREKHGIPVLAAKKRDKAAFVEMMNSDLASGTLKIATDENQELIDEMRLLQWDVDKLESTGKLIEDGRFANHLADALLYAWREAYHHTDFREEEPPEVGSKQWWDEYEAEVERKMEERAMRSGQEEWWEDGLSLGHDDPF